MIYSKSLLEKLTTDYKFANEFVSHFSDLTIQDAINICKWNDCNFCDLVVDPDGPSKDMTLMFDGLDTEGLYADPSKPVEPFTVRYFEKVSREEYEKHNLDVPYEELKLPFRSTTGSAGYDFVSTKNILLKPGEDVIIPLGWKCKMLKDEMLLMMPKSGLGFKHYTRLANTIGLGDSDFFNAENGEGHYMMKLRNEGDKPLEIKAGQKIGQAVLTKYLIVDGDSRLVGEKRIGGYGSTGL